MQVAAIVGVVKADWGDVAVQFPSQMLHVAKAREFWYNLHALMCIYDLILDICNKKSSFVL